MKRKLEEKNRRLELAKVQKEETLKTIKQKKITEAWKKLPEVERNRYIEEEEKRKRLELKEMKSNIWKKWRGKEKKQDEKAKKNDKEIELKLEKLEEIIEKIKTEERKRIEDKRIEEKS